MSKIKKEKKKLHYFTLDKEVEIKFEEKIKNNFLDKSKLIESLVIEYMKKESKKND